MTPYERSISLEAKDAGCDRGGDAIVRGVTFSMGPGEAIQLFGPNGSGKTSLLAMFAGLIPPAEGNVRWRNGDNEDERPFEKSVFFLGHETAVKPTLTAEENLFFWAALYGRSKNETKTLIRDALERLDMAAFAHVKTGRLSAGQRRRIDLARALLCNREIWFLDEPAASLDWEGSAIAGTMIAEHLARGGLAIVATHAALAFDARRVELKR
jgi:heme exporter protein A